MPKKKWQMMASQYLMLERAILTGEIVERQKDHQSGEWKYLVFGQVIDGRLITVVAKMNITNKLVIITVYKGS